MISGVRLIPEISPSGSTIPSKQRKDTKTVQLVANHHETLMMYSYELTVYSVTSTT